MKKRTPIGGFDKGGYALIKPPKIKFHQSLSMFIKAPICFCLLVIVFNLASCAEMARDMGIDDVTDVQMRSGPAGTRDNPAVLSPFKRYDLVMAANECRYFMMQVPSDWFWKVYVTAASRRENTESRVSAMIFPSDPPWGSLPATSFERSLVLRQDGDQAVLAVGNSGPTRPAILRICQEGAPANITLESQVSTTDKLMGPNDGGDSLKNAPHVVPQNDNPF